MSKVIIGVDAGGTKTLVVKWNQKGEELKRATVGFGNLSVDYKLTKKHIKNGIKEVLENDEVDEIIIGVAGSTTKDNIDLFITEFEKVFTTKVTIVTDGFLALKSLNSSTNEDSMIVVGGTGSVVYITNNKETISIGGYGHILGDEGSAYNLVLESIKLLIADYENNQELSIFSKELVKRFKFKNESDLKQLFYNSTKDNIAGKAFIITNLAYEGFEEAHELLKKQGIYLAKQAILAMKKIDSKNVKIALRGGFVLNAPYVKETFIKVLKEENIKFIIEDKYVEPVYGAYVMSGNKER